MAETTTDKIDQLSFDETELESHIETTSANEEFSPELYKKWYNAKGRKGFLSLDTWLDAGKVSVDIGEIGEGGVKNTKVWTNAIALATYLAAVRDGRGEALYPAYPKGGRTTDEAFVYYGGSMTETGPVSRILKIHHWQNSDGGFNPANFAFKVGHFAARRSDSGAFVPDMSKILSNNMIMMSRVEMAEMSYRLDLALSSFAATSADWLAKLNGKTKKK